MKEVVKGRAPDSMDTLVQQTESPFMAKVLHFPLPTKFRMPQIEAFDGAKDPVNHLNTYKNQMELHGYQDPVRCRAFAITLKGLALAWFNKLPPSSVSSFRELFIEFGLSLHWSENIQEARLSPTDHKTEPVGKPEVLCPEVQCRVSEGRYTGREVCYHCIHRWVRSAVKNLMFSISKNPQASMAEVLAKAEKYINGEEALISKKESSSTQKEREA